VQFLHGKNPNKMAFSLSEAGENQLSFKILSLIVKVFNAKGTWTVGWL
jgi:hypothetical protein